MSKGFSSDRAVDIACYLPYSQIVAFRREVDEPDDSPVLPDYQYPQGLEELVRDVVVLGCKEYPLHKFFRYTLISIIRILSYLLEYYCAVHTILYQCLYNM